MIVWCLKDNKKAIKFHEKLGGIKMHTKMAKIGNKIYQEEVFIFDISK